jgi:E3 ubiquitin-protein ligase BAH
MPNREKSHTNYTIANLDAKLADYLARYFPNEVKEKQKANERAATVDRFGEAAVDAKCIVM